MAIDLSGVFPEKQPEQVPQALAPAAQSSPVVVDDYTKASMADAFTTPYKKPAPAANYGTSLPYDVSRLFTEGGATPTADRGPSVPSVLPGRKDQMAYLTPSIWGGADLNGLADAPLASAYKLRKAANDQGYEVLFTSGARHGGGSSYHDHGEAIDVRIQKRGKSGQLYDLTPQEEVRVGRELGKQAGWASMLDEIRFDPSGRKSGNHLHFSYGNERNLLDDPSHHLLNNRNWTDKNYLKVNPDVQLDKTGNADRSRIPSMVEAMAKGRGIDPDIAVRWIQAESGFDPQAKSPAGATGLAQMMPGTVNEVAKELGISPDMYYKSPRHQVLFGMHYLKKQLDANNGNYAQALAAYNAGPGALEEFKQGKDVYAETRNYVHKILGDVDPAVTNDATAASLIQKGGGRRIDPARSLEHAKAQIENVRAEQNGFWKSVFDNAGWAGEAVNSSIGPKAYTNPSDPLSGARQGAYLANEFFNQLSLGFVPLLQSSLETKEARDNMLAGEGTLTQLMGQSGVGVAKLGGMVAGGSMLLKGLRWLPGVSGLLSEGGAAVSNVLGKTGMPLLESLQTLSAGPAGAAAGGPLALLFADTMEQAAVGGLQMGTYGFADWLYNGSPDSTPMDGLKIFLANSFMGGLLGGTFALGVPAATSLGLNALGNTIGKNAAGGSLAEILGQYYQGSNMFQRGLMRTGAGAVAGSLLGGISDVTGISDVVFGKEIFGDSAGVGATLGLAAPIAAKVIDWSGLSKAVAGTKAFEALKVHAGNIVEKLSQAQIDTLTKQAYDSIEDNLALTQRVNAQQNATVAIQSLDKGLAEREGLADKAQASGLEAQKKLAELQKTATTMEQGMKTLEGQHSTAKNWIDQNEALQKEMMQGQQQMMALQKQVSSPQAQPAIPGQLLNQFQSPTYQQALQQAMTGNQGPLLASASVNAQAQMVQLGQRLAEIPKELAALDTQFKKSPELQEGVNKLQVAKQRFTQMQSQLQVQTQALTSQAKQFEAQAVGHREALQWGKAVRDNFAKIAETATSPEEFRTSFGKIISGVFDAGDSAYRTLLDSDAYEAGASKALNTMMDNMLHRTIFSGAPLDAGKALDQAAADATVLRGGDMYKMNVEGNLRDLKTGVEELQKQFNVTDKDIMQATYKEVPQVVSNAQRVKQYAKSSSLVDWEPSSVKGAALLDARTVHDGLLSTLSVDLKTFEADALARQKELTAHKSVKPVAYDGASPETLYDLAVEAKAHLNIGDNQMLANVGNAKDFAKKVMKPALEARQLNEIGRLQEDITNLEQVVNGPLNTRLIKPLLEGATDAKGNPILTPVDPNYGPEGKFAQGAEAAQATSLYNVRQELAKRITQLESDMKGLPPTMAQSISDVIRTGNFSEAPADVQKWAKTGGDLSAAPPQVKEWVDQFTALHIEEVARVRWLDQNISGIAGEPGGQHYIVSALREARAAGFDEASRPGDVQMLYKLMDERLSQADAADIRAYNGWLADMMKSDKTLANNVFGVAQRGWMDLVKNRQNAAQIIQEKMIKPTFDTHYAEFEKMQGKTLNESEREAFYREMADAIEDMGAMRQFKNKYGDSINGLMQNHYAVQTMFEMIRATSPELAQWARANYFSHRWRKLAGYNAAASEKGAAGYTAQMASENRRQFMSLKDADEARSHIRETLRKRNISEDEFLNTFDGPARAKMWEYGDSPRADAQWEGLSEKGKTEAIKRASDKALTLLADDPVVNPLDLYQMQLSSIWRADGMRQLLRTFSNTSVQVETGSGQKFTKPLLGLSVEGGAPHVDTTVKGASGSFGYRSLGDLPGFKAVQMEFDGKKFAANQMYLHPEAFRFLAEFAGGQKAPSSALGRGWNYITNAVRMNTLLGSFIPHKMQILTGPMMEFWKTPYKVANLMGAGKKVASMGLEGAATLAEATRHGLNVRVMEQGTRAMAQSIVQDMGKEFAGEIYGVERNGFLRWLQSMDATDPMQQQAKEALGKVGRFTSDLLGVPTHLDYLVNREALFRPIEYGQLAGYNFRVIQYLKDNAKELASLPPAERMRQAQMGAADITNRLAGAYPDAYTNNSLRKLVNNTVLTPSWFLSKAYTIVDAGDSLLYLGANKLSGGKVKRSLMEAMGRKAFAQYSPEVANAMRSRMGKMIAAGLVGSFAMTQAAQYLIDGTFPWEHPPDKWFHLHHEGTYYTGPVYGYVKDVLRFFSDMVTEDGVLVDGNNLMTRFRDSLGKAVGRQMLPPVEGIGKMLFDPNTREQLSDDTIGSLTGYLQNLMKESTAIPEMIGLDKNNASMADIFNKLTSPFRSEESTAATRANSLRGSQYLLRQLGTYDSKDQTVKNLRGDLHSRQQDIEATARRRLAPYLDKIRSAEQRGDTDAVYEFQKQLQSAWSEGVPVKDVLLKRAYPDGVFRLPQGQFMALLGESINPQQAAWRGALGTPIGEAMNSTMQAYENEGSVLGDPDDY